MEFAPDTVVVHGDRFSSPERDPRVRITGQLFGPPWHWTSWTRITRWPSGTVIRVTTRVTPTGLSEVTELQMRSGPPESHGPWRFDKIDCGVLEVARPRRGLIDI